MSQYIPPKSSDKFTNGIKHPDLCIWDAWSFVGDDDVLHLYSLAVPRAKADGSPLKGAERNSIPFHFRHFSSGDFGTSWVDEGCLIAPRRGQGLPDSKTIWSGSIEPLSDGSKLLAYTGLYELDDEHCFAQNIMLALSDGYSVQKRENDPLLCPRRDWALITDAGYYLAAPEDVGHRDGESGGPITAWRDPFAFIGEDGQIHLYWSAKAGPRLGALGHALMRRDGNRFRLDKLFPPVTIPDGSNVTQFELPKVYYDPGQKTYYLISATCTRINERQRDEDVDKTIRLHLSASLDGPWRPWSPQGSALPGLEGLFGMTVLKTDFDRRSLLCIAPYTDAAGPDLGLTFSPCFRIDLDPVSVVF